MLNVEINYTLSFYILKWMRVAELNGNGYDKARWINQDVFFHVIDKVG